MHLHGRSIYSCGAAPSEWPAPQDCRYTHNAASKRLYVHLFSWPFKHLHLSGLKGRVRYAQFLHDGSEVKSLTPQGKSNTSVSGDDDALVLVLPTRKPPVAIPVIEMILE
jgi:alpha-L-fucosidase